jgi:hypothetical protein
MSEADAAQLLPPPLTGRFQCDGSSEFCSHPLMTWYRSAFDRKRYLAAFAMAKAAAWSCVKRFDAGRANHSRMIAFRASACVIALALQAWPRNDFQMNLAVEVLSHDAIRGEQRAISVNREVAGRVRRVMKDSGATMPESLPLEPPIKEIKKRIKAARKKLLPKPGDPST